MHNAKILNKSVLRRIAVVLSALAVGSGYAEPLVANLPSAGKLTSVTGFVEYGCGGTTGTGCFLVTSGKQSYILGYMRELPADSINKLNAHMDAKQKVSVTGELSGKKIGVFKLFNPAITIDVSRSR